MHKNPLIQLLLDLNPALADARIENAQRPYTLHLYPREDNAAWEFRIPNPLKRFHQVIHRPGPTPPRN